MHRDTFLMKTIIALIFSVLMLCALVLGLQVMVGILSGNCFSVVAKTWSYHSYTCRGGE